MKRFPCKVLTALFILVASAACGAQAAPATPAADSLCSNEYFPVVDGAAWEYRVTIHHPEIPDELIFQRNEIVEVTGEGFTVLPDVSRTGEFAAPSASVGNQIEWSCLPEGLFLAGNGREGITVAKTMETGSTWTTTEPGSGYEIVYTVLGTEEVKVPAGTFEALKVQVDDGGEGQNIFKWYVPGVGTVKEYSEFEGLDTWSMLELLSYSIPN